MYMYTRVHTFYSAPGGIDRRRRVRPGGAERQRPADATRQASGSYGDSGIMLLEIIHKLYYHCYYHHY